MAPAPVFSIKEFFEEDSLRPPEGALIKLLAAEIKAFDNQQAEPASPLPLPVAANVLQSDSIPVSTPALPRESTGPKRSPALPKESASPKPLPAAKSKCMPHEQPAFHVPLPKSAAPVLKVLYVFCGLHRKADVREHLQEMCDSRHMVLLMLEYDLQRDPAHDVTNEELWARLMSRIASGEFDVVIITPPCNTWSRARFSSLPGPRPLRNLSWPWGFPWLTGAAKSSCQLGNLFIRLTVDACRAAWNAGSSWLVEHPEHLGRTNTDQLPASIWALPEFVELQHHCSAVSLAVFQCAFQSATSKPTRLMSTLREFAAMPHSFVGSPTFSYHGSYRGPLPVSCGHKHAALIGVDKATNAFKTTPAAAYPGPLCKALAEAIVHDWELRYLSPAGGESVHLGIQPAQEPAFPPAPPPAGLKLPVSGPLQAPPGDFEERASVASEESSLSEGEEAAAQEVTSDEDEFGFKRVPPWKAAAGRGPCLRVGEGPWASRREFQDGAGLCSPGRWHPREIAERSTAPPSPASFWPSSPSR